MKALAETWEPFRAALEGASVLPGRYWNVVWLTVLVDGLLLAVTGLAARATRPDGERGIRELLRVSIPGDGHPSPGAYQQVAERLAEDIADAR